jgi:hypothetical protein
MARWTKNRSDLLHHRNVSDQLSEKLFKIGPEECHLIVNLRNGSIVRGWFKGFHDANNAADNTPPFPTSWSGSVTLLDEAGNEMEINYLDIETVDSAPRPRPSKR